MAVIRYLVRDVDAALAFYVDKLGFALIERWGPPFAMVGRGDLTLWLSGPGSSASRALADGSMPAPGGWNRLVLETDDLTPLVDRLRRPARTFAATSSPARRQSDSRRGPVRQPDRIVRARRRLRAARAPFALASSRRIDPSEGNLMQRSMITGAFSLPGHTVTETGNRPRHHRALALDRRQLLRRIAVAVRRQHHDLHEPVRAGTKRGLRPDVRACRELGANAILAMRYDATDVMAGITEVLCYGTAVVVAPAPGT